METKRPDVRISKDFIITILKNVEENLFIMNEKSRKSSSREIVTIFNGNSRMKKIHLKFKNKRFFSGIDRMTKQNKEPRSRLMKVWLLDI